MFGTGKFSIPCMMVAIRICTNGSTAESKVAEKISTVALLMYIYLHEGTLHVTKRISYWPKTGGFLQGLE